MTVSRLTFNTFNLNITNNLMRVQKDYQDASIPVQTGYRMNYLSDDPGNISRVFALRDEVSNKEQYQRNITIGKLRLSYVEDQLSNTNDLISRVKEIALQANNSTNQSSAMTELATQLGNLKTELLGYANAQYEGQYIFGGTDTDSIPFSGTPTVFNGNSNAIYIQASSTVQVRVNSDGDTIFTGAGGGEDLFDLIDELQTAVSTSDFTTITTDIGRLDTALNQVNTARANVGVRVQQLDSFESSLGQERVDTLARLAEIREISIDQAITNLTTKETALKLVYASSNRLFSILGSLSLNLNGG